MTRSTKAISRLYRWSDLPKLAGLSLLYMLLANWTYGNLSIKGSVSVFWLPSGLALAALLLGGIKYWPFVFVGSLAAVSGAGYPLWRQLGLASGNTLEALIGAWLLLRSDRFEVALRHAEDYLRIFLAGTAGACAGALTGAGALLLAGRIALPAVGGSLLRWYQGDILSILLLTPLILVWRRLPSGWFTRTRVVETIACFGLAGLLGQITFVGWGQSVFGRPPLGYLAFLFVIWGAVRFGRHGALLLVVMAALQALTGAVFGTGFFASDPARFNLNDVWLFLLALTIVGITVALLFHERKLAEQSLRQAEENLRLLTANLNEMVLAYDMNRKLVYANPAVERLTGYSVASLRREQFICWVHPEDRARMLGHWEDLFRGGGFAEEEYRLITKDGQQRWAAASWGPILDDTGRQVGVQGSERDISDRKTAEDALRESEARFRTLFENAGDAILTMRNDRIIDCNARALQVFGCQARDQVQGRHPYDFSPQFQPNGRDSRELATEKITAALAGRAQFFEWMHARLDGTLFPAEVTLNSVGLGSTVLLQALVRDITERKRAEEENAKLQAQLNQAQKMESIGRLAGGVAHDFNNLLTVINGYSQMLLARLDARDPLRATIAEIHKAGERAVGLTRQLLAFSRKQVLQPRALDLNRVLEELRPMLGRLVREDVEVRMALSAESGTVHADPHQLEQVIMNLAVNARDAMPHGGKLGIETAVVEWGESQAQSHPGARAGRYVMLAVSDSGIGMDEATRQRIFEPFFTTKEVGKGTGLGLSMVDGIVEQSGGYIEVYSEPGHGSTFKIYLPALAEAAAGAGMRAAVPAMGGKETVLVVEDQEEVRKFAADALGAYGYQVIQAANADEALLVCERESIDLVLTDVVMPNLSGRELADRLKKRRSGIKVLFMSGYTDDAIVHHGVLENSVEFIEKPFGPDQLAVKVREVLAAQDRRARIVVADDEPGVRSFLRLVLEDAGYAVTEAANGKEALKEARAGRMDLLITDLVMPEQEGIETIRALRKDSPGIPIIAISGAFGGQFLEVARLLGSQAVLSKPVSAELLLAKVAEVLKSRR